MSDGLQGPSPVAYRKKAHESRVVERQAKKDNF